LQVRSLPFREGKNRIRFGAGSSWQIFQTLQSFDGAAAFAVLLEEGLIFPVSSSIFRNLVVYPDRFVIKELKVLPENGFHVHETEIQILQQVC
jgi:hypothetical protein